MKAVTQKDDFGCSLAKISFLLDKDYREVVGLVCHDQAQIKGFCCKKLAQLLAKLGESYAYK